MVIQTYTQIAVHTQSFTLSLLFAQTSTEIKSNPPKKYQTRGNIKTANIAQYFLIQSKHSPILSKWFSVFCYALWIFTFFQIAKRAIFYLKEVLQLIIHRLVFWYLSIHSIVVSLFLTENPVDCINDSFQKRIPTIPFDFVHQIFSSRLIGIFLYLANAFPNAV